MAHTKIPRYIVSEEGSGQIIDGARAVLPTKRGLTWLYGRGGWFGLRRSGCRGLAEGCPLSRAAYQMLFHLLSKVEPGNHIMLRSIDIARGMGLDPSNASRALTELRQANIIFDRDPWGFLLNPEIGFNGDLGDRVEVLGDGLSRQISLTSGVKPSRPSKATPGSAPALVTRPTFAPAARPALPDDDPDDPGFPWAPPPDDDAPATPDDGTFTPVKL